MNDQFTSNSLEHDTPTELADSWKKELQILLFSDSLVKIASVERALSKEGILVWTCSSERGIREFLRCVRVDCCLADIILDGPAGVRLIEEARAITGHVPLLCVVDPGDVSQAVTAIKAGANEAIERTVDDQAVALLKRYANKGCQFVQSSAPQTRANLVEGLTSRELEILGEIARGSSNKSAGKHLGISHRTVEAHRARLMRKVGAHNTADLVRIALGQ